MEHCLLGGLARDGGMTIANSGMALSTKCELLCKSNQSKTRHTTVPASPGEILRASHDSISPIAECATGKYLVLQLQ